MSQIELTDAYGGTIAVLGLGYVGLPLACLFASKYSVVGFDVDQNRIDELREGFDRTQEVSPELLLSRSTAGKSHGLTLTADLKTLQTCEIFIITVPTPIDAHNKPDLSSLLKASEMVGSVIRPGSLIIFESTVYPGATEEECVPVIEKISNLQFNQDFYIGYSPERINPGDKEHTVENIKKVTSGSTPDAARRVNQLYGSIIKAGTHMAPSIKVAEAAKVIENAQRDINIAFVNELSKIFDRMHIDTQQVLEAASTKWNFLPFRPGLVGGHCIGVDPYYLSYKAQEYGYHPEIILAGRRLNDSMGEFVGSQVIKLMLAKGLPIKSSEILVLGITFKENCNDVRNTKVIDVIESLNSFGANVTIYDPLANHAELERLGYFLAEKIPEQLFDSIVLAVPHDEFIQTDLRPLLKEKGVLYDVKAALPYAVDGKL